MRRFQPCFIRFNAKQSHVMVGSRYFFPWAFEAGATMIGSLDSAQHCPPGTLAHARSQVVNRFSSVSSVASGFRLSLYTQLHSHHHKISPNTTIHSLFGLEQLCISQERVCKSYHWNQKPRQLSSPFGRGHQVSGTKITSPQYHARHSKPSTNSPIDFTTVDGIHTIREHEQ